MLRPGARNRRERDGAVEAHQPSSILHGKSEQIDIRDLSRPMKMAGAHVTLIEQADGTGPEFVVVGARCAAQALDGFRGRHRTGILGLTDNTDESILGQSAGGPAVMDLPGDPLASPPVVDVARGGQRPAHADAGKGPHHPLPSAPTLSRSSW